MTTVEDAQLTTWQEEQEQANKALPFVPASIREEVSQAEFDHVIGLLYQLRPRVGTPEYKAFNALSSFLYHHHCPLPF